MATRRHCATALLGAISILVSMTGGVASAEVPRTQALIDLNTMRAAAGLMPVRGFRKSWNSGCRRHNAYMSQTGEFGHTERRDSVHYSRSGAKAAAASVVAQPSGLPSQTWGNTIYHRQALMQPRLRVSGFDASSGFACLRVFGGVSNRPAARTRDLAVYPYPADGTQGHSPDFDGNEFPSPFTDAPGAAELGTPITASINGPWRNWRTAVTHVTSASLISETGTQVPVSVADCHSPNAAYLQGGFAILPRAALTPETWHTVHAEGTTAAGRKSYRFSRTWRFRTGSVIDLGLGV